MHVLAAERNATMKDRTATKTHIQISRQELYDFIENFFDRIKADPEIYYNKLKRRLQEIGKDRFFEEMARIRTAPTRIKKRKEEIAEAKSDEEKRVYRELGKLDEFEFQLYEKQAFFLLSYHLLKMWTTQYYMVIQENGLDPERLQQLVFERAAEWFEPPEGWTYKNAEAALEPLREQGEAFDEELGDSFESELPELSVIASIRPQEYITPNDKISRLLFAKKIPSAGGYVKTGSNKGIVAAVKIQYPSDMSSFNFFDRAVNRACCSLWAAGTTKQSFAAIARELTHKPTTFEPTKEMVSRIEYSCKKQMRTWLEVDTQQERELYPGLKKIQYQGNMFTGRMAILVYENGERAGGMELTATPINYEYANEKNQIIRMDSNLFKLPTRVNMTTENIIIREYLLDRLSGMNRKMSNTVKYEHFYTTIDEQTSNTEDKTSPKTKVERKRQRDILKKFLTEWKGKLIQDFEEIRQGKTLYAVKITPLKDEA